MSTADLAGAASAVEAAQSAVHAGVRALASRGSIDDNQVIAYDLAHAAAGVETARTLLDYGAKGDVEARISCAFVADVVADLAAKVYGREDAWGLAADALDGARAFVATYRDPAFLATLGGEEGPRHLDEDFELVQDTFRRFADDKLKPVAEHIHRENTDIPEEVIAGLAEMGGFGLSVPEEYGGFAAGGESDYLGMVIATEELSRGSLGAGGSLITRPEILTRALVKGGTEAQKQEWLPKLATAEVMAAVAVTEPDYGSDVAGIKVTATPSPEGDGWCINGVKTWCTFAARADVLMLLARTDPDRSKTHRGLSLFVVPKPRGEGHGFEFTDDRGGKMEGRAIDTIGYRGMHSYEIAFDNWFVSSDNLVGGDEGLGRGFYLQMAGFENGRLQTAARAVGVMQAAYEEARQYALDRVVFGQPIGEYELTKAKLARMATTIQAARQFMYEVARLMAKGEGTLEAAMVKAYVCKAAEWVTREAMQIHGGFGYAEEYPVSRYFVDARVLSIFEGADETLCLKVIARRLLESA
jgi:(2S)-methylsuccinyl-CoA dehydrogenase